MVCSNNITNMNRPVKGFIRVFIGIDLTAGNGFTILPFERSIIMKVSDLQDYLKYVREKYGDLEIVTTHREEGWPYPEFAPDTFVPVTNVDVEQETSAASESNGKNYVVIT